MNFSVDVMVLQPTSMSLIIILAGDAAKIDHIKVWNNDLKCFVLFCFLFFSQKKKKKKKPEP